MFLSCAAASALIEAAAGRAQGIVRSADVRVK
jgi:hypothetical protein